MTGIHSVAEDTAGDVESTTNQDAVRDPLPLLVALSVGEAFLMNMVGGVFEVVCVNSGVCS